MTMMDKSESLALQMSGPNLQSSVSINHIFISGPDKGRKWVSAFMDTQLENPGQQKLLLWAYGNR